MPEQQPALIQPGHVTDSIVLRTVRRLNDHSGARQFFQAVIKAYGNARWDAAMTGLLSNGTLCLVPVMPNASQTVSAVIAVETGRLIGIRVIDDDRYGADDSTLALTPEGRLLHLFKYRMNQRQSLAAHGVKFGGRANAQDEKDVDRAAAITMSICYQWSSCTGDGRGNCVGNYILHTECVTSTYWTTTEDYFNGGDFSTHDGGGNGVPATTHNYPRAMPPPEIPINDVLIYLGCFSPTAGGKLTVYVDQPLAGAGDPFTLLGKMGHAFLSIEQVVDGRLLTRYVGFYPATSVNPFNRTVADSRLGNDEGKVYDLSLQMQLSPDRFLKALQAIYNYRPTYDLENYNCTDFVLDVVTAAGEDLPRTTGWWIFGRGRNPGSLGQALRGKQGVNKSPGDAGPNIGSCP